MYLYSETANGNLCYRFNCYIKLGVQNHGTPRENLNCNTAERH